MGGDRAVVPEGEVDGSAPVDRRTVVEATAWRFRTGAPWRDVPERFGNWNTIYKNFNRWTEAGVWARVLEKVQSLAHQAGDLDWVASIDSTIVRWRSSSLPGKRPTRACCRQRSRRSASPVPLAEHGRARTGYRRQWLPLESEQGVVTKARDRDALRQDRPQLPRRTLPRRHPPLATSSSSNTA